MGTVAVHGTATKSEDGRRHDATAPANEGESSDLTELLTETRILLPGTEVFLAFLTTLPFTNRFAELTSVERHVYLFTFFSALTSFVCFVAPAAYHRIARPIHDKPRFKVFANVFLVAGLVPVSISVVLATFLVTSVVVGAAYALWGALAMTAMIGIAWWVVPMLRAHDRFRTGHARHERYERREG